jgi:Bifunctional PLP-dependent enzyme with beta-cystathionase and maltose regulon repressor activities
MWYDFDQSINRVNSSCQKWDERKDGCIPMGVADMDFMSPPVVIEAIKQRADHGVFGYQTHKKREAYYQAVIGWMKRRHNWDVEELWIHHAPGVVAAISYLIETFTEEGDKIVIQPPVYFPFKEKILLHKRQVVENPLKLVAGRYEMDFADLYKKIIGAKILILCNPHNPVGRAWTREELTKLGKICLENNVLVISDEIHADIIFPGYSHTVFATISKEFAQNCIICSSASKTFNLAALKTSNIIIPNAKLGDMYEEKLKKINLALFWPPIFGSEATEAAYNYGEEWLEQLLKYLNKNIELLTEYIEKNIKKLKVIKPEATFLVWVDCRDLGMDDDMLEQFMIRQAKVDFNHGYIFGHGGEGFVRINVGCTHAMLKEALERMEKAIALLR